MVGVLLFQLGAAVGPNNTLLLHLGDGMLLADGVDVQVFMRSNGSWQKRIFVTQTRTVELESAFKARRAHQVTYSDLLHSAGHQREAEPTH